MGGAVPQSPPIGTFKPGGEDAVKEWIDDDRIANGIKPRYRPLAAAFDTPPVLRANANAPATPADPDPNNLLEYGPNFGTPEPVNGSQELSGDQAAERFETRRSDDEVEDEPPEEPNRSGECAEIRAALPEVNDKIDKIKVRVEDIKDSIKNLTEEIQALEKSASDSVPNPETRSPRDPRRRPNVYLEAARMILKIAIAVWRAYSDAEKRRKIEEGISERKAALSRAEQALADANAQWDSLEKELFRLHTRRVELKCDDSSPYDEK